MDRNGSIATRVEHLMPAFRSDLERLARIPSIAFPGYPKTPVREAPELVVELLRVGRVEAEFFREFAARKEQLQ